MGAPELESWGLEWVVFSGCWFSDWIGEWGFSSWLIWDIMDSGNCGWGVCMIMDIRGPKIDGVGSGMTSFGLMFWGAKIGGSEGTVSERICSERTCSSWAVLAWVVMEVIWRRLVIKPKVFGLGVGESILVDGKDELLSTN